MPNSSPPIKVSSNRALPIGLESYTLPIEAMDSKKPMIRRAVISSFIFKFPPDQPPQVALFRRSDKVRTYPNCLAPVSGSIDKEDPSPLHAAWREIQEETTLTPATLTLLRRGKDYVFSDEGIGREWTIYPFAFRLNSSDDESRIQIDWEHQGFAWFDPREVRDVDAFGGVPRLAESLRRVWFEIDLGEARGKVLRDGLLALRGCRADGLAERALGVLVDVAAVEEDESVEVWWRNVRLAGWHLWKNGGSGVGADVLNVMVRCLAVVEKEVETRGEDQISPDFLVGVTRKLRGYEASREASVDGIWNGFSGFLREKGDLGRPIRILALASSPTVQECLRRATTGHDSDFDIRILESRPLFEGVSAASDLAGYLQGAAPEGEKSVGVSVYTDAAVAIASEGVDLVVVGADSIDGHGAVSSKTGSLPAILSTRYCAPEAKVVVLVDTEKVLPYEYPEKEEKNVDEVVGAWKKEDSVGDAAAALVSAPQEDDSEGKGLKVSVKNIHLERVPTTLVDRYIFEDGPKSAEDISELAGRIRREADAFFSNV